MIPIILYSFKFIIGLIIYFKFKLKYISLYLFGSLILDILTQVIRSFNHYPKPYTGDGLVLFLLSTFCYLSCPTLLLFCSSLTCKNKISFHLSLLSILSIMIFIITNYPIISGVALINVFYTYFATLFIFAFVILIINIKSKIVTVEKLLLLILNFGGIVECLILTKFTYSWLHLSNFLFYSLILIVALLSPKYARLLPPSE